MIEIKKSEIEPILLNIATLDSKTGKITSGLLSENLPLGTKRALQKIRTKLLDSYKELIKDIEEVQKECEEDKEKLNKELKELFSEMIKVEVDKFKIESIENVSSSNIYDFELLDKISI